MPNESGGYAGSSLRTLALLHGGLAGAVVGGGAVGVILVFVRGLGGFALPFPLMLLALIGGALVGGLVQRAVVSTGGAIADAVVNPKGESTAYAPTFSHIEALEARGDLDGAAKAWAEACDEHPENALVLVKSADFHLRLRNDAAQAVALYRAARDMRGASRELVRYSQAKIVDLFLGPLKDEGRALVELRRLIESFPGTREAEEARGALARIKAQRADP